jgi:hypothetical protein
MNRVFAVIAAASVSILAAPAHAEMFKNAKISSVQLDKWGSFFFTLDGQASLCTGGSGIGYNMIVVGAGRGSQTAESIKIVQSTILAAYLAGKPVDVIANAPTPASASYCDLEYLTVHQ